MGGLVLELTGATGAFGLGNDTRGDNCALRLNAWRLQTGAQGLELCSVCVVGCNVRTALAGRPSTGAIAPVCQDLGLVQHSVKTQRTLFLIWHIFLVH